MKNLLILISLLLLSPFLTSCEKNVEVVVEKPIDVVEEKEKGVLYERKVNGEWGWYKSGDENKDNGKYEGEIENGIPNGLGVITYLIGDKYVGGCLF